MVAMVALVDLVVRGVMEQVASEVPRIPRVEEALVVTVAMVVVAAVVLAVAVDPLWGFGVSVTRASSEVEAVTPSVKAVAAVTHAVCRGLMV